MIRGLCISLEYCAAHFHREGEPFDQTTRFWCAIIQIGCQDLTVKHVVVRLDPPSLKVQIDGCAVSLSIYYRARVHYNSFEFIILLEINSIE
jgi:hypothetical protein